MRIGVTGTRYMLDVNQLDAANELAETIVPYMTEFHHGDCVGADVYLFLTFYGKAVQLGRDKEIAWHCYPAFVNPDYRAETADLRPGVQIVHTRQKPLVRDKIIAESVDQLFAFPRTRMPVMGSGTWATIDFATIANTPVKIVYPEVHTH